VLAGFIDRIAEEDVVRMDEFLDFCDDVGIDPACICVEVDGESSGGHVPS